MATRVDERETGDTTPPVDPRLPPDTRQPRPNPLREGLRLERMAEPCTMVICGATGDLTERKLAPALYNTLLGGFLPPEFTVVGFARRELDRRRVPGPPAGGDQPVQPQPTGEAGDLGLVRAWRSSTTRATSTIPPRTSSSRSASTASTGTGEPPATGSSTSPSRRRCTRRS